MTIKLGVVMDSIEHIIYKKDSTLAMLWEAYARHWEIYYFEPKNLYLKNNEPFGDARLLKVFHDPNHWYEFQGEKNIKLSDLNVILMRKNPPFNAEYIYLTYILEQAECRGTLVVNRAQSLRDANEKLFTTYFPECVPPNIVTNSIAHLRDFWDEHEDIVCKPLDSMGGISVFRLKKDEVNANVIFEMLTKGGTSFIIAQQFIPEITKGDKRILLINGEAYPHALVRVPQGHDWRGNLAVGAKGILEPLTSRDKFICDAIGPDLKKRGLYFVGIDIIGDYLTEINVTSPTGIRELDDGLKTNISALLMDCIEKEIESNSLIV